MQSDNPYKEGARAYAKWFAIGFFSGAVLSLIVGKWLFTIPLVLGMLCGAIAFEQKTSGNGTN